MAASLLLGMDAVPVLSLAEATPAAFQQLYDKFQVVLLKRYDERFASSPGCSSAQNTGARRFGLGDLAELYASHPDAVGKTWGVENGPEDLVPQELVSGGGSGGGGSSGDANGRSDDASARCRRWYGSFLVQLDAAFEQLRAALPLREPTVLTELRAHHTPCIWVFVCKNVGAAAETPAEPFRGRVEHIDAVQHSGTWHLQVSGTKTWKIRPNSGGDWGTVRHLQQQQQQQQQKKHTSQPKPPKQSAAAAAAAAAAVEAAAAAAAVPTIINGRSHLEVTVEAGDVFIINTRLWFHQTHIDDTSAAAERVSFSYARDFFFPEALESARLAGELSAADGIMPAPAGGGMRMMKMGGGAAGGMAAQAASSEATTAAATAATVAAAAPVASEMTNVEGTYATHAMDTGTVVLQEEPLIALVHHGHCGGGGANEGDHDATAADDDADDDDSSNSNNFVACACCLRVVGGQTLQADLLTRRVDRTVVLRDKAAQRSAARVGMARLPANVAFCSAECEVR